MNKRFIFKNILVLSVLANVNFMLAQEQTKEIDTAQSIIGVKEDLTPGNLIQVSNISNTNAISTVKGKDLVNISSLNITNRLFGQLAGLTVTQGSGEPGNDMAKLLIRGIGSYGNGGYNVAKIYVDGFEVNPNYFSYMNSVEIESITILKDAAALATFGMRGANGVIWVVTKRGKVGKSTMNIRFNSGIQSAVNINKPLDSYGYAYLYNQAISNDNGGVWSPQYSEADLMNYQQGQNVDWYDSALKGTGIYTNGNIDFNGGDENARYNIVFDYGNQKGIYNVAETDSTSNNRFYKLGLRANLDFEAFDIFEAKIDIGGRLQKHKLPNYGTSNFFNDLAKYPSNIYPVYDNDDQTHFSGTNLYPNNPVGSVNGLGWSSAQARILQGNFVLKEKLDFITKGLYLEESFSFNSYVLSTYNKTKNYGRYIDGQMTTTDVPTSIVASGYGSGGMEDWKQAKVTLGYERGFDKHHLIAAINFHYSDFKGDGFFGYKYHYQNFNGRFNYNYDNRYVAELAFSYFGIDAYAPDNRWGFYPAVSGAWIISNEAFMKDSEVFNLLKLRASVGTTGNSDTSVTGSLNGFSSNGRYLYQPYYSGSSIGAFYTGNGTPTWQNTLAPLFIANEDVFAEKSLKYNVGIEFGLFNKLRTTFDAFLDKRSDILTLDNSIPSYYGNNYYYSNIGKMTNKGFELTTSFSDEFGDFKYAIMGMASYAKNKIDYMAEVPTAYPYNASTGRAFGTPIGLQAVGLYQLNNFNADGSLKEGIAAPTFGDVQAGDIRYRDLDDDGYIDQTDYTAIGKTPFPELTYSFGGNINYHGVDFSILFQGAHGASVNLLNNWNQTVAFVDNGNAYEIAKGAWAYYPEQGIDTRDGATYPRLTTTQNDNNYQSSTYWMKSADYLRIRHMELGYSFSTNGVLNHLNLSKLRVFVNASNFVTWSSLLKDYNLDPETVSGYPALKSITTGVLVGF